MSTVSAPLVSIFFLYCIVSASAFAFTRQPFDPDPSYLSQKRTENEKKKINGVVPTLLLHVLFASTAKYISPNGPISLHHHHFTHLQSR
jgi:hypothetical protein